MTTKISCFSLFLISLSAVRLCASTVTIMAVGDIMLGRYVGKDISRKGYAYPYMGVRDIISSADIAFANLECPISSKGEPEDKQYCFRADPGAVEGLNYAGFDVLSLANNHALDYGEAALHETIHLLKENHILPVGAGKDLGSSRTPAIIKKNDMKVAFLAYDCTYPEIFRARTRRAGTCPGKIGIIEEDIERVREIADVVVISFHWGIEYSEKPTESQIELAHQTIDAGADLILGHHPHVLQGIEFYRNKLIVYSLGNFIFDQRSDNTSKGMILKCVFRDRRLERLQCIPIVQAQLEYYPRLAEGEDRDEIASLLLALSRLLTDDHARLQEMLSQ